MLQRVDRIVREAVKVEYLREGGRSFIASRTSIAAFNDAASPRGQS